MERPLVLIVSQDEDILVVFGTVLRHAGFTTREVRDPSSVLETVLRELPALIITNYPTSLAGATVTAALRRDPRTERVPILSVTSRVLPEDLESASQAGVTASLCMPVPLARLVEEVRRITGSATPRAEDPTADAR